MIGETVSHYKILEKLGRGGMGEVYKAEDTRLRRIVALKFLSPELTVDEDARIRFTHEAQAASALQHHNICTIHEIDRTSDGRMFICMDYYAGDTLKKRIDRGPMHVGEAVDIATQIAEGLARAHAAGTVHRDIKPANICVADDGGVKILDFGLAMLSDRTRVTKMGTTVGTVSYMSPENARGDDVGPATDVWSLGVILYELLAGRPPFTAEHEAATIYTILNEEHTPVTSYREDIPGELERIVNRALSKDPGDRYGDAGEMARDLRQLAGELDSDQRPAAPPDAAPSRRSRYWIPVAAIAVIAVAILVLKPLLFEGEVVSAPQPIAVITFENKTGDPEYDYLCEVIPNLLITSLEQSKYLSVVTWERMYDLLAQTGRADVELIDREIGFEVCRLDGVHTIVLGSFTRAGDVFATDVKVLDVDTKELLKSASARGNGVGSILDSQIDELGGEISRGAGLSERKIAESGSRPIAAVTTRSMDAYDYFVRGREAWHKRYRLEALRDLEKAVELDSTFAVAWLYIGLAQSHMREIHLRTSAYEKAKKYAAAAPEKDRLYIDAIYAEVIGQDDRLQYRLLTELTIKYPKEKLAWYELGVYYRYKHRFGDAVAAFDEVLQLDPDHEEALNGMVYVYAAQAEYERAVEYAKRNAAAHPENANPHDSMGEMYFLLGRLDEAIAAYERALSLNPYIGSELAISYIEILQGNWTGAIARTESYVGSLGEPGLRAGARYMLALYYYYFYRRQTALEKVRESEREFESLGAWFSVSGGMWLESVIHLEGGRLQESLDLYDRTLAVVEKSGRETGWLPLLSEFMWGLADVKKKQLDSARARIPVIDSLLVKLPETNPEVSEMFGRFAAQYRAEVLLAEGDVDEALAVARALPRVTIPAFNMINILFYNFPYERDVLARAYVRKGDIDKAIAEYERLVTFDPEGDDRRLVCPLFHHRLGMLYEQKGLFDKAIRQYDKFLEICGDAGPALEEVAETRRRLAAFDR
jgi:serine/threonine protein kinase/tetratricopeptide (TPR) repeat protein